MSDNSVQLIKDRLEIVDFLRQYLKLTPSGKNYKALCPFHKEKTPSFMVSPDRQSWHCFGSCATGGDVIAFLMKYENVEFYDALKVLAEKAGVDLKTTGNRDFQSHNALYSVMAAAEDIYKKNLANSSAILAYARERGLMPETINEFGLGLAFDTSDGLTQALLKSGYNILDIERAGLTMKTDRGTYWDRFRSRLMFPIYNHVGKAVAFTGRILPGNENPNIGKYVNSPETPIFQKSKIVYGLHKTKNNIRQANQAVLVEGQMDFLMMWQDGIKNVVATSGTALTQDHLTVLRRLADELVLSFDNDEAGQAAAERGIDLADTNDFSVKLLIIDDKKLKDPADFVKSNPGRVQELVRGGVSAMEYYFHKYLSPATDSKIRKNNLRTILGKIKAIFSPIDRNHWLQELSRKSGVSEAVLLEELELIKSPVTQVKAEETVIMPSEKISRRSLIAQRLLGIMLHLKSDLRALEEHMRYFPAEYASVYNNFLSGKAELKQEDLGEIMNAISLRFSFENQTIGAGDLQKEKELLLRQIKIEFLKEKQKEIGDLIDRLEKSGDELKLAEAMQQYAALSKELQSSV